MKFLIVFALALSTGSAFRIHNSKLGITNGENSAVGQFPYQVGLSLELRPNEGSWCGGSVIGEEWILTAAHCTDGVKSATVYLGATERTKAAITYYVIPRDIIIHSDWNRNTLSNDISLIKIPATAYTAKIKPVKLPSISSSYSTYASDNVIASGWGLVSDSANSVTNDLQWARMKVIDNNDCRNTFSITSSNLCVSTPGGVSTCRGDSGGPLVLESSKVQVGLTSFGALAGCAKGYPAVFTRLTSYLRWIEANTGISY